MKTTVLDHTCAVLYTDAAERRPSTPTPTVHGQNALTVHISPSYTPLGIDELPNVDRRVCAVLNDLVKSNDSTVAARQTPCIYLEWVDAKRFTADRRF